MPDDLRTTSHAGDGPGRASEPRNSVQTGPGARPPLTPDDVRRLTLYKWRYSLESCGFSAEQVGQLLFLKWLYANHPVRG